MSILDRPAPDPDLVLSYDDRPDAVIDVYLPHPPQVHHGTVVDPHSPSRTGRLVVYLHGGFWREAYDRTHARPLAATLAAEGAVVALPEFRRVGGGGGWPVTCTDVREAVGALPRLLAEQDLEVGPTTLTGHSAGGHLILWLVAQGVVVDRAVAIAPVGDLAAGLASGIGDGAVADFLARADPDPADPAVLLAAHRPAYPVTVLHGADDDVVPLANSRGLVARHPWIDLVALPGVGHFDPIDPLSTTYPVVREALAGPP